MQWFSELAAMAMVSARISVWVSSMTGGGSFYNDVFSLINHTSIPTFCAMFETKCVQLINLKLSEDLLKVITKNKKCRK